MNPAPPVIRTCSCMSPLPFVDDDSSPPECLRRRYANDRLWIKRERKWTSGTRESRNVEDLLTSRGELCKYEAESALRQRVERVRISRMALPCTLDPIASSTTTALASRAPCGKFAATVSPAGSLHASTDFFRDRHLARAALVVIPRACAGPRTPAGVARRAC